MSECIFCKIAEHKELADVIFEDDKVICFLPKKTEAYGHCLIVPKKHYENIFDIDVEELSYLMKAAKKIALRLEKELEVDGINLLHASGETAGQSVGHFHFHLLPRFKGDEIEAWPLMDEVKFDREEFLEIFE